MLYIYKHLYENLGDQKVNGRGLHEDTTNAQRGSGDTVLVILNFVKR